jgi:hypothetical protein
MVGSRIWLLGLVLTIVALPLIQVSAQSIGTVSVCIYCSSAWSGSYSSSGSLESISGTTPKTYDVFREGQTLWIVSASVSKTSAGSYNLTVTIETLDGGVLERGSTTTEFGFVSISWSEGAAPAIPGFPWLAIISAVATAVFFSLRKRKRAQ